MPEIPVDLYTDQPCEAEVFDQVHILENPWKRSKIDAMAATRFKKTVYLDADIVVLEPIDDIFEVLSRFDLCGVHDQLRNTWNAVKIWRNEVPSGFPQINTGLIGYRKRPKVLALFREWSAAVRDNQMWRDQPAFRDILWESDLRLTILPEEYNFLATHMFTGYSDRNVAPKVLHSPQFHRKLRGKDVLVTAEELWGAERWEKLLTLQKKRQGMERQKKRRRRNL